MQENDINTCTLTGTITGKALTGKTSSEKPFAVFSIITKKPKKTTIKAACLGKTAIQIKPYLKSDSRLGIHGYLGESKNGIQIAVTGFINFNKQKQVATRAPKSAPQTSSSTAAKSSMSAPVSSKSAQSSSSVSASQRPAPKVPTSESVKRQAKKSTSSSSAQNPFANGTPQMPRRSSSNTTSSSSDDLPF